MTYKVIIERNQCSSCGNCQIDCPEFFQMDQEGLAHLKGSKRVNSADELELEGVKCCLDAALSCPVLCIHVFENGKEMS